MVQGGRAQEREAPGAGGRVAVGLRDFSDDGLGLERTWRRIRK